MLETGEIGFDKVMQAQQDLGRRYVLCARKRDQQRRRPRFQAPGVVVSYTRDDGIPR